MLLALGNLRAAWKKKKRNEWMTLCVDACIKCCTEVSGHFRKYVCPGNVCRCCSLGSLSGLVACTWESGKFALYEEISLKGKYVKCRVRCLVPVSVLCQFCFSFLNPPLFLAAAFSVSSENVKPVMLAVLSFNFSGSLFEPLPPL